MNNKSIYLFNMVTVLVVFFSQSCLAEETWDCKHTFPGASANGIIAAELYVGNEMPIGSTIYRTVFQVPPFGYLQCSPKSGSTSDELYWNYQTTFSTSGTPAGAPFTFSGISFGSGQVFPTNVSGVAVAFTIEDPAVVFESTPVVNQTYTVKNGVKASNAGVFAVSLIKTGAITPGGIVDPIVFPNVIYAVPEQPGYTGLRATLIKMNFNGGVRFITSTCTTPDFEVDMGEHRVQSAFHGVNSTTPWVDSSITLYNCPTFSGYYNEQANNDNTVGGDIRIANMMTLSLTPTTSVIDAPNGVIAVNNIGSIGEAATGVGIQLGYSSTYNANPLLPTTIWKPGAIWDITPPNTGQATFKIPLAARYYQTEQTITSGPANAKVTFNIDYK